MDTHIRFWLALASMLIFSASAWAQTYTTRGTAVWNTNGNWSIDGGATDCGCNPAGQNGITVVIRHSVTVTGAADIGLNNIIELEDNGDLLLQVQPVNPIAEIKTSGTIASSAILRFGYVPVSNNVTTLNNLDNTNPLVAVIFQGGDGTIPVRLGTETLPKPYPSVFVVSGNKTMLFPSGTGSYAINGNLSVIGPTTSLTLDAAVPGNMLEVNGALSIISGGAVLNANDAEAKLVFNQVLRNNGGTVNGSLTGLEFSNDPDAAYEHAIDGGTIPTATWGLQSNCIVTGANLNMPGGWAGQQFGNLIWDCNSQNTYMAFNANFEVLGTFSVIKTRNPSFTLGLSVASTGSYTLKVNHFQMIVSYGDAFFAPYGGTNPADIGTLEITGDCTITGGTTGVLNGVGTSRLLFTGNTDSFFNYNASFNFHTNARWVVEVDKSLGASVNASGLLNFVPSSGTPASFLRLTNGTFNLTASQSAVFSNIQGSATLQMGANSQLELGQHNTLFLNTFSGTVNLDPSSTIIYRSENPQRIFVPSIGNYANLILDGENNLTPVAKEIYGDIEAASLDIRDNADFHFAPGSFIHVRITGNLINSSGASTITHYTVGYTHTLELQGISNEVDNFTVIGSGADSYVVYNRNGNQQVFASPNYVRLVIDGGGAKTLQGDITVGYSLDLADGRLQLGTFNLTYNGDIDDLIVSDGWVETNGSGKFIYGNAGSGLLFPVGDDTHYQPLFLEDAVAGASVRFGASSPGLPSGSVGSWFINNGTTNSNIVIDNPQGGTLTWGISQIGLYTASWTPLTTSYPFTDEYEAFILFTGTDQELAVFGYTPVAVTQPIGNRGMFFDGTDDYLTASPIGTISITMSAWIKPAAWGGGIVSTLGPASSGINGFALEVEPDGQISFSLGEEGNRDQVLSGISNIAPINKWTHVAGTYDGNTLRLYIDGILVNTAPSSRIPGVRYVSIGATFNSSGYFRGQIDEVRIFNTVRSAVQITADMGSSFHNGAQAFWRFEEGTGTTTVDSSPHANTATLAAAPSTPLWALRVTTTAATGTESFRQVIADANLLPGPNYIDFSIPTSDPNYVSGVWTIQSFVGMPPNVADGSIIDGYSAFGSAPATLITPATIVIQIQAPTMGSTLQLAGTSPVTVRGLSIAQSVSSGLAALWVSGSGHIVQGNHIGVNAAGDAPFPASTSDCLVIQSSSGNLIGGTLPEMRNVIGGAATSGIRIDGISPSNNNQILGNYIGVAADGTTPLPNLGNGISIDMSATGNQIGNGMASGRNIIANNGSWGVEIKGGSNNNTVRNNHIFGNTAGGILLAPGSNSDKPAPVITGLTPVLLSGTCQAGDIVEVFTDTPQTGTTNQGRQFVGLATVTGTTWTLSGTFSGGTRYTATATNAAGSTSPFSASLPTAFTTAQSGNWNDPSTWVGGVVPLPGANITIQSNHIISADVVVSVNNLTIAADGELHMNAFPLTAALVSLGGTLNLGTGTHALGSLTDNGGTGKLIAENATTAALIGTLTGDFFDTPSNKVIFGGILSYALPVRDYPTLQVIGAGIRTLPTGTPITINGHLVNSGSSLDLIIDADVIFPNSGLLPHLIQGTSGNTITFNGNVNALGDVKVLGNYQCLFDGTLSIAALFENACTEFIIGASGNLNGSGTFRNLATVTYLGASAPSVANLELNIASTQFIYAYGTADVAATSYNQLIIRGNTRSIAPPGNVVANTVELGGAATPTVWILPDGALVTVNGNLVINNPYGATLNLGTGDAILVVNGNLLASAPASNVISLPALGKQQVLELKGTVNELFNYYAAPGGDAIVRYNGTNQQVFGSNGYMILEIAGGGTKSLQADAVVNEQLRLFSGILQLNNYDLTLSNPVMADQLTGTFASSWVRTNGSGKFIRQGSGTNIVFPVGDAVAVRPVTFSAVTAGAEVSYGNVISPAITVSNVAAGMWTINAIYTTANLTFDNVGGTADANSEIHTSSSPWVLLPTLPSRPPYTTAIPVTFSGSPQKFTVYTPCLTPVIALVRDESAFLCSPTQGRITIYLQPASVTPNVAYDVDLNGDNIWDRTNMTPAGGNILVIDNIAAGTFIINPRVRVTATNCVSLPFPFSLTVSGGKPLILSAEITAPTSCTAPDGKLKLRVRNGIVGGLYHVDLNNDNTNEFTALPLQSDSTITVAGIAEGTLLPAVKIVYAPSNCASAAFMLNAAMPEAPRPTANLRVFADTEADPDEILTVSVADVEAGVIYRLMNDTVQIGAAKSGLAGSTLTFTTEPMRRNTVFRILAKNIASGCEIELEQKISVRVYHEVNDSLILVALYNAADGANWQPRWDLHKPVRTWHGVSVRKGRVTALNLKGKGLKGLIAPVVQLARLTEIDLAENNLEFDAFEGVLPALLSRGVRVRYIPQAPVDEEQTITEFETKTVTLQTNAKGTRNAYQWFKNNRLVAGATGSELTLRNLTVGDSGVYHCEVRNPDAPDLIILRRRIRLNILQYMRSKTDSLILVELYRRTRGDGWIKRFEFEKPVALWFGIKVANGRVTRIHLANNNLQGEIPDIFVELRGLGVLDSLEYLNLSHNRISGRIPESLTNHRKLTYLDLSYNLLEGDIPSYIGAFDALRTLWLSGNRFTRLPPEIGRLSKLTNLLLDNNLLEELPVQIEQLQKLEVLHLNGNRLRSLPASIEGIFGRLKILGLADNEIESLPTAFERLPDGIEQIFLHNNRLSSVPLSIADRPRLQLLTLYGNRMDFGTIEPLMIRFRERRSTAQVIYAPQAPVGTESEFSVEHGQPFTLTIRTGGTANRYRWFKDDTALNNDLHVADYTVSRAQAEDTGRYRVQITNPHAPELTLTSLVTQVLVTCGTTAPVSVRVQGSTELCGNEPFTTVLQVNGMDENIAEVRWLRNGSLMAGVRSQNFTPQTPGRYRAMVRTEGANCFHVSGNEIEIRTSEHISLTLTVAQGGRLFAQIMGNPSVQRYEWFRNGQLIASTSSREFTAEQPGSYTVSLITEGGCRFNSPPVVLDNIITGLPNEPTLPVSLRLYPNPAREQIKLQSDLPITEDCRVLNMLGQPVSITVEKQQPDEWVLNVSGLPSGTYLLRCITRRGDIWMKWVKE